MTFSISALVSARDSHISPTAKLNGLYGSCYIEPFQLLTYILQNVIRGVLRQGSDTMLSTYQIYRMLVKFKIR